MNDTDTLAAFRALHAGPGVLLLPNAWDAASAAILRSSGARAIATTSAGLAWSCGYPDGDALSRADLLHAANAVCRAAADLPVSIDTEAGYSSDPQEVADLVVALAELGAAGINLEDGADSPELLAAKIAAIKRALRAKGRDIFINARTDLFLRELASGEAAVREAVSRVQRYAEAGADGVFVPMASGESTIRTIAQATALPLNLLAEDSLPTPRALYALGVRRLSAGTGIAKVAFGAARAAAETFLRDDVAGKELFSGPSVEYGYMNGLFA
jgi:2-methylisocitrate lyase-like PEP mutase family enzyme